jgi:hypothetical protein
MSGKILHHPMIDTKLSDKALSLPGATVRIHLPTRPLPNPPLLSDPPSPIRSSVATLLEANLARSAQTETKRAPQLPRLAAAVEAKNKHHLLADSVKVEAPIGTATPMPSAHTGETPISLCWGLLTTSAAILFLQIWNYLS